MNNKLINLMVGFAIGDAIGLPKEGLSPKAVKIIFGEKTLNHSMIVFPKFRGGLFSDDTEHLYITSLALLKAKNNNIDVFAKILRRYLKLWFLSLPSSGGMATYKACIRLLLGLNKHSGIHSAGNGVLMRVPVIAAYFYEHPKKMLEYIDCSSKLTHIDNRAIEGAQIMGYTFSFAFNHINVPINKSDFFSFILPKIKGEELHERLSIAQTMLQKQSSLKEYAQVLNLHKKGVTGYINNTVPIVIYAWLKHSDYEQAITSVIQLGGDTDTTAALVGALVAVDRGINNIPLLWRNQIKDYPITLSKLKKIGISLGSATNSVVPMFPFFSLLVRNLLFFPLIIFHAMIRLIMICTYAFINIKKN